MQFHEFLGQVQSRARLSSLGDAETATRATFETLRERLAGGEPKDVASQLPDEIGKYFDAPQSGEADRFDVKEFYRRVSQRAGVQESDAVFQARAVFEVFQEAVTPGLVSDVREQLTDDFQPLFEAGSTGKMSS
jgi:uncharacterized protein (DUF2267 family)